MFDYARKDINVKRERKKKRKEREPGFYGMRWICEEWRNKATQWTI